MNPSRTLTLFLALALLGLFFLALSTRTARAGGSVLRITTSSTTTWPCGDLVNWSNPCALQTALTNAPSGYELWVASGTYTPTAGTDRTATFQLRDGIALYGGFAGGETVRTQRNFTANVTILSGDLNGDDSSNVQYSEPTRADNAYHVVTAIGVTTTAVLDGFTVTGGNSSEYSEPNNRGGGIYSNGGGPTLNDVILAYNSANYYGGGMSNSNSSPTMANVTFGGNSANVGGALYNDSNSSPTLNSVTFISNTAAYGGGVNNNGGNPTFTNVTFSGNSTGGNGGAMENGGGSPTLTNVTFIGNTAYSRGGGMHNWYGASPTLTNVTFISNSVPDSYGYGGGMYNDNSNPVLRNVTFSGNSAWVGGGMQDYFSNSTLNNVTFISNTASGAIGGMASGGGNPSLINVTFMGNSAPYGGGMGNDTSSPTLTNVTFVSNTASNRGGGMINSQGGNPTLTNVTFFSNTAGYGGGGMDNDVSSPTIRNAIFWGNTAPFFPDIFNNPGTPSLSYSIVQGGCPPGGSTCTHIITTDPLLGALGNYGGATQTIPIAYGSSAIDAGNDTICPATDQRGVARPQGLHCDIGAFELEFARLNLPLIKR